MIGRKNKISPVIILLAAVFSLIISGCDDFSFYTKLDGSEGLRITSPGGLSSETLTIVPKDAVLPIQTSYAFSASGGNSPYTFSLVSGVGSIDEDSGLYSALSASGEAVIVVIDNSGWAAEATIVVVSVSDFTIAPTSITLYIHNNTTFSVLGGVKPYSWSIVSGTGSINGDSGTYTAPESAGTEVIRVTDSTGNFSDAAITVLVPFSLSPSNIQLTVNNSYTLSATGGKIPYIFTVDSGGGTINPDTGKYTAPAVAGAATVGATDALGNYDSTEITITPPAALLLFPASITLNINDSAAFSATGGTAPYVFTVLSGDGSFGAPSGTYTAWSSTGTDIIRLTDNIGAVSDAVVTIVSAGPLSIVPSSVVVEQDEIFDFYADGGTPPYTYSVTSGSGTINSASGLFTAPSATGTSTARVTDSLGAWAESDVDIAPAAPTDLATDDSDASPNAITLTWTDNATGEDGFEIERKLSGGILYTFLITVGADVISYIDITVSPNNIYGYRIKAYRGAVESEYSNEAYDIPNP